MSDLLDNRMEVSNHKVSVPRSKLSAGSVVNKHPVVLDDGRTIVFISDKSREREIRLRYALKKGY
jgi:Tol biopolymer transport system component